MELPQDSFMLLSVINTYLRDEYDSFEELCDSLGVDREEIKKKLSLAGFEYIPEINQFK